MKKDTTNDMTVGSPVSLIIKFMIPMCLGNLFQQFYNIADSIAVSYTHLDVYKRQTRDRIQTIILDKFQEVMDAEPEEAAEAE